MSYRFSPELAPRTTHVGLYEYAFHGYLSEGVHSIIDFGAGDNDYSHAYTAKRLNQEVTRVDLQYATTPPLGGNWIAANVSDAEQMLVIPEHSHDVAIASFLFQHLSDEDQYCTLQQMRRIAKHAKEDSQVVGNILIYPVFRQAKIERLFSKYPGVIDARSLYLPIENDLQLGDFKLPTLMIRNIIGHDDHYDAMFRAIAESGALRRNPLMRTLDNIGKLSVKAGIRDTRRKF